MAIGMARHGGLGIIHRFQTIEAQCEQIKKVKRAGVFMNPSPITISENTTYAEIKELKKIYSISSFLVVEDQPSDPNTKPKLKGILTNRDVLFGADNDTLIHKIMTPRETLIYYQVEDTFSHLDCDLNELLENCKQLLFKNKI